MKKSRIAQIYLEALYEQGEEHATYTLSRDFHENIEDIGPLYFNAAYIREKEREDLNDQHEGHFYDVLEQIIEALIAHELEEAAQRADIRISHIFSTFLRNDEDVSRDSEDPS